MHGGAGVHGVHEVHRHRWGAWGAGAWGQAEPQPCRALRLSPAPSSDGN